MSVFVLVAAALTLSCGSAPVSQVDPYGEPSGSTVPSGATGVPTDQLVLRWRLTGGVAGRGAPGTVPDFSLYADGRAIVPERGETSPRFREYRLTMAALQRAVEEARTIGLDRPRRQEQSGVADVFTLTISFGRAETSVDVYGDGESDPAVRFARESLDPARWPAGDQAVPARRYEPERLAVMAWVADRTDGERTSAQWPFGRIDQGTRVLGAQCTVISGSDVRRATRLLEGDRPDARRWISGGRTYAVRARPLLPDERTCADLTS
ncbi:hypothetical protein [Actinomadura alba]|uniref:Lipoprotein n=1 Tax=Actinomadura alba TaxID=406431 RepID=A0ABR7M368_9ACTN|nr:hypothetical protein [Actinomadura alba]MBC6471378.1 hypothetical protein [Actinomadura alba]